MKNEFTAIIEKDGDWYISYCPEVPGANGQGKTRKECLSSLKEAIALILQDRLKDALKTIPKTAIRDVVVVR
jgi:predicted RNase H-like HicB family nuclease